MKIEKSILNRVPPFIIEVKLDDYGKGGGVVEGEIIARKVNCCC